MSNIFTDLSHDEKTGMCVGFSNLQWHTEKNVVTYQLVTGSL